jgi:hypothetical protein
MYIQWWRCSCKFRSHRIGSRSWLTSRHVWCKPRWIIFKELQSYSHCKNALQSYSHCRKALQSYSHCKNALQSYSHCRNALQSYSHCRKAHVLKRMGAKKHLLLKLFFGFMTLWLSWSHFPHEKFKYLKRKNNLRGNLWNGRFFLFHGLISAKPHKHIRLRQQLNTAIKTKKFHWRKWPE